LVKDREQNPEQDPKRAVLADDLPAGSESARVSGPSGTPGTSEEPGTPEELGTPEEPKNATHFIALAFATGGGVGYIPLAPGTFGALVGVALFFAFENLGFALYLATVAALTAIGVWASERVGRYFECEDDGRIVIDEVAGQLFTLAPLVVLRDLPLGTVGAPYGDPGAWKPGTALEILSSGPFAALDVFSLLLVTGFVLFRGFDIWKPGAIGWAERKFSGGVGVMADDMMAGLFGAILLTLPAYAALAGLLDRVAL
jgi:phosphatidylglycerophosphatase A